MLGLFVSTVAGALGLRLPVARLVVGGAALLLAAGALWGVYAMIKNQGAEEVRREIERKDHEAGQAASEARDRLRKCFERGGLPDLVTGECDR